MPVIIMICIIVYNIFLNNILNKINVNNNINIEEELLSLKIKRIIIFK